MNRNVSATITVSLSACYFFYVVVCESAKLVNPNQKNIQLGMCNTAVTAICYVNSKRIVK